MLVMMTDASDPQLSTSPSARIDSMVDAELTRLLYRSVSFGLFSNLALAALMVAGSWTYVDSTFALVWLGANIVLVAIRWAQLQAFNRANPNQDELPAWRRKFILGLIPHGAIWGVGAWMFLNAPELLPRMLAVLILGGLNSGAARSLASVKSAYLAYALTTLGPVGLRFLTYDDVGGWTLAACTLTYALFLINTASLHRRDLQELHRLNFQNEELVQSLTEARDRAESANRAKSEFLAIMSHEIRTPMNGVIGMLDILPYSGLPDAQRHQVDIAMNSADSLLRLLNDILDLSRIEAGELKFEQSPFSVRVLVGEVSALLSAPAATKKNHIRSSLDDLVPDAVMGDSLRLRQILLNLLGNAVKFTANGSIDLNVETIEHDAKSVVLQFSIIDTGIGMSPAVKAKLFQNFSQGDSSTTRRYGGSGLGLAISQRLVKGMGGEISVESEPDKGSRFHFTISLPLASELSRAQRTSFSIHDRPPPARPGPRILIAEDESSNLLIIRKLIEQLGYTSTACNNGAEAVSLVLAQPWDLILMDVHMPHLDGIEATKRIRADPRMAELPIIALTASATLAERQVYLAAGLSDVLPKPVTRESVSECLNRWLPV